MDKTPFVGYETLSGDSEILAVVVDGEKKQAATEDDNITLVLSETPFYAESGGQVGDVGVIKGNGFEFTVENTTKTHEGVVLHHGYISDGETVSCGDKVHAEVNRSVREATMRNHTAAHLLQAALRKILGTHVEQAGQLVNSEAVRFDFTHFSALSADELRKVENTVNEVIMSAVPVVTSEMPIDEAKKLGAMALFGEKYGDIVRVVKADDFSVEFCGGTHVKNTGSIGLFKIVSESSVASGVRRIEAVTGNNVMKYIDKSNELIAETAKNLKLTNYHELASRAAALSAELKEKEREISSLEAEIAASKTADLMKDAKQIGGVRLVTADIGEAGADALRSLCDKALESGDDIIAVFAGKNTEKGTASFACRVGKKAIECGAHAGNIVREVARVAGGAGGGKPDSAMAGAKDVSKIPEALEKASEIVGAMLLGKR